VASGAISAASVYAINDSGLLRVIGRHFDFDPITCNQTDESLTHLAGNVSEDEVLVIQFNSEHGSGKDGMNRSFQFYGIVVFIHNCVVARGISPNSQILEAFFVVFMGMKIKPGQPLGVDSGVERPGNFRILVAEIDFGHSESKFVEGRIVACETPRSVDNTARRQFDNGCGYKPRMARIAQR
tara:strand:- start:581 stop:1129 length:549 start_codon:yes stop_codon:yes gene_type:complete